MNFLLLGDKIGMAKILGRPKEILPMVYGNNVPNFSSPLAGFI